MRNIGTRTLLILLLLLLICSLQASENSPTPTVSAVAPHRIILTWNADPAHSQAVSWRTDTFGAKAVAQIANANSGPIVETKAKTVNGITTRVRMGVERVAAHNRVVFDSLEPATEYIYRVGDGKQWSDWNSFRTADTSAAPFSFIYLGDSQDDGRSGWSLALRAAIARNPSARFIAFAGDLVEEGYDDALWDKWCLAHDFISAGVPVVPAPGNHDLFRSPTATDPIHVLSVSALWNLHFALPMNGPDARELRGQAYYFDYQGVRFIVIDPNVWANQDFVRRKKSRIASRQLTWLEAVLRNNPNRWTIVMQHQPMYPITNKIVPEMQAALVPLYDKYGVDIVLQGHDHIYSRTHKLLAGNKVSAADAGTYYVTSVSGPKMYRYTKQNAELMEKVIENTQMFQTIDVSPHALTFHAYSIDGLTLDSFKIEKE